MNHAPRKRALLIGYYGRSNFGDDVLLVVSYHVLRRALPDADIAVIVDSENADYVRHMLGDVTLLPPGRHGHVDYIIHGGGGVFFDFLRHGWLARFVEAVIEMLGFRTYVFLEQLARSIARKPRTSATRRIALGVGVGTFSPGSPRLRQSLPILADFDAIWVRDPQSATLLQRFSSILTDTRIEGSDLAFLTEHWLPSIPATPRNAAERPRLGIVLRDWPETAGGTQPHALRTTLEQLAHHYAITGFVFDAAADPQWQRMLASYPCAIWNPQTTRMDAFATALASQDVLLTSRAHGAICGACLGVPSAIVDIEPKLRTVHAMLPNSSVLVRADAPAQWGDAIARACTIDRETIAIDVAKNRAASQAALHHMIRFLP